MSAPRSGSPNEELTRLRQAMRPASPVIDLTLWVGQYPFRQIPNSSVDHLRSRMAELRIERGVVSGLECLFAENNLDAYRHWAERLEGDGSLEVWPVIRPGATRGLERLLDRFRPRGLRLLPNYHGFRLSDRSVEPILRLARERGMIAQVFQRVADERWHWMLKVPPVDDNELLYFAAACGQQPLLISGLNAFSPAMLAHVAQSGGVYLDLSRIRGPQFTIEQLASKVRVDRIVFGSLWPIQIIEATLWQVTTARLEGTVRAAMLADNARRLLSAAYA